MNTTNIRMIGLLVPMSTVVTKNSCPTLICRALMLLLMVLTQKLLHCLRQWMEEKVETYLIKFRRWKKETPACRTDTDWMDHLEITADPILPYKWSFNRLHLLKECSKWHSIWSKFIINKILLVIIHTFWVLIIIDITRASALPILKITISYRRITILLKIRVT